MNWIGGTRNRLNLNQFKRKRDEVTLRRCYQTPMKGHHMPFREQAFVNIHRYRSASKNGSAGFLEPYMDNKRFVQGTMFLGTAKTSQPLADNAAAFQQSNKKQLKMSHFYFPLSPKDKCEHSSASPKCLDQDTAQSNCIVMAEISPIQELKQFGETEVHAFANEITETERCRSTHTEVTTWTEETTQTKVIVLVEATTQTEAVTLAEAITQTETDISN